MMHDERIGAANDLCVLHLSMHSHMMRLNAKLTKSEQSVLNGLIMGVGRLTMDGELEPEGLSIKDFHARGVEYYNLFILEFTDEMLNGSKEEDNA